MFVLRDFTVHRPPYELTHGAVQDWLSEAHGRTSADPGHVADQVRAGLARYGCDAESIQTRRYFCRDFTHTDWSEMTVYRPGEQPFGGAQVDRMALYDSAAAVAFGVFYDQRDGPAELLHVTCTGYTAPSAAERVVSDRRWGQQTQVTHVYHMGCYASFPAVSIAMGKAAVERLGPRRTRWRADIVHTEFCGVHLDLEARTPEHLVMQSLFADGCITYSLFQDGPGLQVLTLREEIVPDSLGGMTWKVGPGPMQMSLSRSVPLRIARGVQAYVERLFDQAGLDGNAESARAVFAVHPGGPRIIELVQRTLGLADAQVAHSKSVLRRCGNMSSATLPHVWGELLADPDVEEGTLVVSMAFGPGLTLSGGLFRKRG